MLTPRWRARHLVVFFLGLVLAGGRLSAMEKPEPGQLARYTRNGTLDDRLAFAEAIGNHRTDPALALEFETRLARLKLKLMGRTDEEIDLILPVLPPGVRPGLASKGTSRIFALLIDFPDYPASITTASVDTRLYADGDGTGYPYESLRNYYRRASYNQLEIQGVTLGWYRPAYTRASISQTTTGRENLIKEALTYFDSQGHNFSQYDNNDDGVIDYFCVFWTGPDNGWANFWWGYYTSWGSSFTLDGKQFQSSRYSWQYVLHGTTAFTPRTVIHETGHSLGLPDLYDYDTTVGVPGGVGGLDMMDANWGDHNAFSKMLLDWLTPQVRTAGTGGYALGPSGNTPDALIIWPTYNLATPFAEFFIVQRRTRADNDSTYPADGLLIWHIDATLSGSNNFLYNNSYSSRKLVRLMEADGLEEIEQRRSANAGDFYTAGRRLAPDTTPSSQSYSGVATNVFVDGIQGAGASFTAALGGRILQILVNNAALGTTSPLPGSYSYADGASIQVSAVPAPFCSLRGWSGDASGRASPVTLVMTADRSITGTFALVNPPSGLTALRQVNRSLTQSEQVVDLRWSPHPGNASLTITGYRVYRLAGTAFTKVADLGPAERFWRDRKVAKPPQTYAMTSVNDDGVESDKVTVIK